MSLIRRIDEKLRDPRMEWWQDMLLFFLAVGLLMVALFPLLALAQSEPQPSDAEQIGALVREVMQGHRQLGILGALSAGLVALIRAVRLPLVQRGLAAISPSLAWSSWPKGAKIGFVFLLSTAGALLTSLAGGQSISLGVIIAGAVAGMGAIALNEVTEAAGDVAAPVVGKLPGAIQSPLGVVLPPPRRAGLAAVVPQSLDDLRAIEDHARGR